MRFFEPQPFQDRSQEWISVMEARLVTRGPTEMTDGCSSRLKAGMTKTADRLLRRRYADQLKPAILIHGFHA